MWIIRKQNAYIYGVIPETEKLNQLLKKLSEEHKGKFVITSHYPPSFPFYVLEGLNKGVESKWVTFDNCPQDKDLAEYEQANVYRFDKPYQAKPLGSDQMGALPHGHYAEKQSDPWIKREQKKEPKEKFIEVSLRPLPKVPKTIKAKKRSAPKPASKKTGKSKTPKK